ncbi:MAG: phosphoribosyl-AMP cyclohydrolase [Chloroflexota bacterium]|nr:phosphoribosyl-AMP cyclohydrolase [Chloroflexota bacterium]
MTLNDEALAAIKWNEQGLIPAIVQDARTRDVLMMAYMNADSLNRSLALGQAVFWSRRRRQLWRKGETSGNTLRLVEVRIDCDADTLLLLVEPAGPTCHTGAVSCFFRDLETFSAAPNRY